MEWGGEAGRGDQEADPKGAGAQLDMQSCLRDQGAETGTATRWVLFCFVFERSEGKLSKEKCESEHERGQLPVGKGLVHGVGGGRGVGLVRTARRRGLGKEPAPPHAPHWVNIQMLEIKKVIKIRQGVNPNAGLRAQTGVQTARPYPERVSDAFLVHPLLQNQRRAFLFLSLSFAVTKTSSFLF